MKSLRGVVLVTLFAASGCEKPNDLPRLQDEAVATAKIYQQRLDELAHRAAALGPRVAALPSDAPDSAHAREVYQQAQASIEEHRRDLQQQLLPLGNPDDLARLIDRIREGQERGVTEATSKLSAVESWIAIAEQRQSAPRAAAAVPAQGGDDRPSGSQAPTR